MYKAVRDFQPRNVLIDPVSNLISIGTQDESRATLIRIVDFLKTHQITALLTSLTHGGGPLEQTDVGISSLIDTWLLLRDLEANGERNRVMYLLKSRGMAHSNQLREYVISDSGIHFFDAYTGTEGVLTGWRGCRSKPTSVRRAS